MISKWAKLLATGVIAASFVGPASAQTTGAEDTAPTAPAMWRVADADSEFILIGTFHILPPGLEWRTNAFNDAFKKADAVYFEVETDTPTAQSTTVRVMMTEGFNPPGTMLSDMLDSSDTQKMREIARDLGLPFAAIDPMRPWQAFLTFSVKFIIKQGFDPGAGVDTVLSKEARTLGKDTHYFETLEEQLGFFTELPPEIEKALLVLTIRDWDAQAAAFDTLFNAWRTGDADFIDQSMNETMRDEAPQVFEKLIVERNNAWAKRLTADIKNSGGNALVAVGAGHLVGGEYSLPALLAAQGFEVSRYGLDAPSAANSDAANDNTPAKAAETDEVGDLLKAMENN